MKIIVMTFLVLKNIENITNVPGNSIFKIFITMRIGFNCGQKLKLTKYQKKKFYSTIQMTVY